MYKILVVYRVIYLENFLVLCIAPLLGLYFISQSPGSGRRTTFSTFFAAKTRFTPKAIEQKNIKLFIIVILNVSEDEGKVR